MDYFVGSFVYMCDVYIGICAATVNKLAKIRT